ncbi:MAG: cellulase family glycosylhydrolase [Paludibacteraceae bacterium]|nr:cellulase family glycosylhydrolase [Paludibacteraceae bacterium]
MKHFFPLLTTAALAFTINASAAIEDNYIEKYGRLNLNGKMFNGDPNNRQLSDKDGNAIRLEGWSSSAWMSQWGDCHQKRHLEQMKQWGARVYRGAMFITEEGGYNDNKEEAINQTKTFIDQTAELGMYYICDWHMKEGNPNDEVYSDAPYYFKTISEYVKSKGYIHVLYEICNEPNGCTWSDIKQYADKILPIIQENDPGACVIVGTPQWDQNINEAQENPIQGYDNLNILYSFHYYACSHQQFLSRLVNAAKVIPVFISEWSIADFDPEQQNSRKVESSCYTSAEQLINIANGTAGQQISWCASSFSEKESQASSLMSCENMKLSNTGMEIFSLLPWICCEPPCCLGPCYENLCQEVPGIVDLGRYDMNEEGNVEDMGFGKIGSSYVGGGEGVAYHELNSYSDEKNDRSLCNGAFKQADEDFFFRQDECVDAKACYGFTGQEGWHNLCYIEPEEWIAITLDIQEPGYYSIEALCNFGSKQVFGITSITYNCNLLVDKSNDKELNQIAFVSEVPDHGDENDKYWEWTAPVTDLDTKGDASNYAVLFKETGKHTIKITFQDGIETKPAGDLGPLNFTKVKAYNGLGYDTKNEDYLSFDNSLIFPNPSNGNISVATAGELIITDLIGEVVFSAQVEANTEISTHLKAGNYIAKVKTTNAVKVAKIIIK